MERGLKNMAQVIPAVKLSGYCASCRRNLMYFRILRTITVPTLILGVGLAIPAFAQSQLPPRPNVVVNLAALPANGQQPGNSSLVGFTASNAKGRKLLEVTPDQQIEISPDGKSELMADSANTQSGDSLSSARIC